MKILQLNIWGGRLGKQIIELLHRESPDIVCLQEAIRVPGGYSFLFEDLDEIVSKTEFAHHYFVPQFGYRLMKRTAQSGLAILSTTPFESTSSTFTRLEYVDDFDLIDTDYNVRSLQHVTVRHEDTLLHVLNHHGHHVPEHKNGDEETMRQCAMIRDYVEKLDGKIVLTGDFNLSPRSESLEQLNAILTNHCIEVGIETTRTSLTKKTEVCDYIFTNGEVAVKNFRVLDDLASDHKALVLEF